MGYEIIRRDSGPGSSFTTIQTPSGTAPTADSETDTLTFTSTGGTVAITGNAATDTINFEAVVGDPISTQRWVDPVNGSDVNDGSIGDPFATIQAALTDLDAANVTDYDNNPRVQVILAPGEYTENLTIPRRKYVEIVLNGSVITGNVTWNINGSFFSDTHQQKLVFRGSDIRSMYTGVDIPLVGVDGDITVNGTLLSGCTPQIHLTQSGVSGDITFDSTDVGGYNSQVFVSEGFINGDVIVVPAKGIANGFYAKNCDTSASMAIGGFSGRVTLAILTNTRILRAAVVSGTGGGRWINAEFASGPAHDFTGYAGTVTSDSVTYNSWFNNVPTKGTVVPVLVDAARGVAVTPDGNLAATDVQAALTELQTDVDTRLNDSDYVQVANKDLHHDSVNFISVSNGYIRFNLTGSAVQTQIVVSSTAPRVITLPDATTTLVGTNSAVSLKLFTGLARNRTATAIDYVVLAGDDIIGVTNTSVARAITLCAANAVPAGYLLTIKDESGGANSNNITVSRAGSDTIDGATTATITSNYGIIRLYSDGSSKWFII